MAIVAGAPVAVRAAQVARMAMVARTASWPVGTRAAVEVEGVGRR